MTYSKFIEVKTAAFKYAEVVTNGKRIARRYGNELLKNYVKLNGKKAKNSDILVFLESINLGNVQYPEIIYQVATERVHNNLRETDKSFIFDYPFGKKIINKSMVIGWLHYD